MAIDSTGETARQQTRIALVREHVGLLSLLASLEAYHDWIDIARTRPIAPQGTVMPRTSQRAHESEVQEWKSRMIKVTNKAVDALDGVLKARWITLDQGPGDVAHELRMLRDVFLPEVVISLQHVLYESRHVIPGNLQRSIDLAQDVADEEHGIYKVMQRVGRLQDFLDGVRISGLTALAVF
jgi:nuclear pore complex protein Nup107